ncbi:MAG: hypothetical protein M1813_009163 [Trichoglossum hirsutum]|nr:MAG: hypothetical protein M1813_009163 [Trichoglossum hirsutum]
MESDFSNLEIADVARKILIACDFGTTYSGLAWAQTSKHDYQEPIQQWPGAEGITREKVPTMLKYTGSIYKWGYQIKELEERHEWFKLDLDPTQSRAQSSLASKYPSDSALPPSYDVSYEKLIIDFLTALRQNAEYVLSQKLPSVVLRTTPREWIITIPAMWSDSAKAKARACAERAGMGSGNKLHVISEPEAAAVYALHAMDPHNIKVGDTFVVCDAGGGTVDLISYTVSALKPILQIKEAAAGNGSLCGSTFLNRIFTKLLRDRFQNDPNWDEEILADALEVFDTKIKRAFAGDRSDDFFTIPIPGIGKNPALGVERAGKLRLSNREVRAIFDPVVNEVVSLVKSQIKATRRTVRAVLMVGGFGQNAYLKERITVSINRNIEVIQTINSWTAVVRGALMKGLEEVAPTLADVRVTSRCARKHYGIEIRTTYNGDIHNGNTKKWDGFKGTYLVLAMSWLIQKGDDVKENEPTTFSYYNVQTVSQGPPKTVYATIKCCEDPYNVGAPVHADTGVKNLVKLTADLSKIPYLSFKQKQGTDNKMWYVVEWEIRMTCYSAETKYSLVYNGVEYDTVTAEYV